MKIFKIIFISLLTLYFNLSFAQNNENEKIEIVDKNDPDLYEILITYIDGTNETVKSEFYADEITGNPFIFKNNCERIYADQTSSLVVKNYKNEIEKGISVEKAWYFEVEDLSGEKLKVYNDRPYKQGYNNFYFQKKNGDFVRYCAHTIKDMVRDNPKALKHANLHSMYRDLRTFVTYGSALIGIGTYFALKGNSQVIGLGAGILVSSVSYPLFTRLASKALYRSIKIYNVSSSK